MEKRTSNDPELPEHDEGTSNTGWSHLSRIDGDGRVLRANTDAHDEARSEQFLPGPRETGTDRSSRKAEGGNEDLTSSAEVVVERIGDESTTGSTQSQLNWNKGEWNRIGRLKLT